MSDIMIDLETLGRKPGCVVTSIGAARFDLFGSGHLNTFHRNIELTSSLLKGFTAEKSTVEWWQKQDSQAIREMGCEAVSVEDACFDFVDWFNECGGEKIWCQGLTFDVPILEHVLSVLDIKIPWKFYNTRDTRTVYDVCEFNPYSVKRDGTYHNALDDSLHQINCVQTALRKLKANT